MELPQEINPRIWVFLFIFLLLYVGIFQNWIFYAIPLFPQKTPVINTTNITPNVTIIYRNITVLVTPTPDGHTYYASEYQNGTRLLQRPFTFIRYNVYSFPKLSAGEQITLKESQDMKVTTIVYDYKTFEKLHWFNPATYKYAEIYPTGDNKQFLFIFIYAFMDDVAGDDTRMWMFNRSLFAVYDGVTTYRPIEYPYQIRYRELENTYTFDHSTGVQAFKSLRLYSASADYQDTAGEYSSELYYLRGGKSNAIDGYLIFEVDKNINLEETLVLGQFYTFGAAQWRLKA
jgi:hypothetical protein